MTKRVVILGAGLSGLLTAFRLKKLGYEVKILEARDRIGGRIYTFDAALNTSVEMGATWFGLKHTHLLGLLNELGLGYYEQHTKGDAFFEPFSLAPPQKITIPEQMPSYRIAGGSNALIEILKGGLQKEEINLGANIHSIEFQNNKILALSNESMWEADLMVSTLPPGLLFRSIKFSPNLDEEVYKIGLTTHTWMQDSIKTAIIYKNAFWREDGLSGTLFSNVGPFSELYDHSNEEITKYALCGFVNGGYARLNPSERQKKVMAQLEKIFGTQVNNFIDYKECIWNDEWTKHPETPDIFPHNNNGHPIFEKNHFDNRFFVSGSETARHFPGYMDGAVQSAERVVADMKRLHPLA
jgi:monoamine oxidase